MSRARTEALDALLRREVSVSEAVSRLSAFGWDSEQPLRELRPHLVAALEDAVAGRLSSDELTAWSEAVGGRDDLAYEEPVQTVLFELSSPEMHGERTAERLAELLRVLKP